MPIDDEADNRITKLPANRRPVDLKPRDYHACRHSLVDVDDELRQVFCRTCGETLDPVQVLINLATKDRKLDSRVQTIREFEERERQQRERRRAREVRRGE